jgi:hypothetical protein
MKRFSFGFAVLAFLLAPQATLAQDGDDDDGPPETVVVTVSTMKVPLGEDRGKFMEFVERVVAPQARNNPNVRAFHVLAHYWGHNSSEVKMVRVYEDWADVEASCGEPCQTWADENVPEEGEEGYEEFSDLQSTYFKYLAKHSDEIYSSRVDLSKMPM